MKYSMKLNYIKKTVRKILCFLRIHSTEIEPITIRPVFYHMRKEFLLPTHEAHMWKCKYCKYERIIR